MIAKKCENCGSGFLARGKNAKYCDECKPIVRREQIRICHKRTKRQYKGRGKEVFNPYGADLVDMSKYHSISLDEKVKKCNELGISYGEFQKQMTLKKMRGD